MGLLCISESLSAGCGWGEEEERRDEGLQRGKKKKRSTDGFCCEATSFLSNQ